MSTTRCENYSFPWIFKDCRERTGPHRSVGLYRTLNPSSGQSDFRVVAARKIAHFETELPYLLGSTNPCPTAICTRGRFTQHRCQGFFTDLHACLLVNASLQR
ncbi:uncharacterized protein STEHIDRAFT_135911 [Stereum hirsutum FP-91666 SS1]|uniref:Uncharacterized protein n=1 Tax=Stereum hirsutum (strain FP-91666) TaxID=721885 RepID=R7RVJ3_STEHR|nr:uncharacterized protein STEHIDRAFT_135911 [Stereum hirsutum FP-91666 SS1]EIM79049.1 hypothetical protein STEHIDRAFT_135911 [Stereum hirsutum FP-91666 SS1]